MRIEGDCVETWPQGMVMSGSGAARVEILRSAWILCDYLQRGMSRLTSRNVLTPPPHCLTAPCLEYHKLLPRTIFTLHWNCRQWRGQPQTRLWAAPWRRDLAQYWIKTYRLIGKCSPKLSSQVELCLRCLPSRLQCCSCCREQILK